MNTVYDLIIIGAGPAGLAAGIYASRAELNTIIIEKQEFTGGQVMYTEQIDNYPGLPGVTGMELAERFRNHCEELGGVFVTGEVVKAELEKEIKSVSLDNGSTYYTKTVLIAGGAKSKKLGIKGEEDLIGMGVSYCATCDGAFFKDQTVAVVGGGDVAVEDALYLSKICKKVYVIHRRNEFRAAKHLCTELSKRENIEVLWETKVSEIIGRDNVERIVINSSTTVESKEVEIQGIFIAIGSQPQSCLYRGHLDMDDAGYIIADESCKTSTEGVFVAGDIRKKALKQIVTAVSDGANSITSVEHYIYSRNIANNTVN